MSIFSKAKDDSAAEDTTGRLSAHDVGMIGLTVGLIIIAAIGLVVLGWHLRDVAWLALFWLGIGYWGYAGERAENRDRRLIRIEGKLVELHAAFQRLQDRINSAEISLPGEHLDATQQHLPKPRALLVEDEKAIRDVITPWLFRGGFDYLEAADGQEAIDLLATGTRIHVVLSNLLLPSVDGFTLLLHVKQHYPHIPFAFVTAINDSQVREEATRNGADGYLLKPFTEEEFLKFVRGTIAKSPFPQISPGAFSTADDPS